MSNTAEIKYNKEQANYGIEQLKQCQKELYEADVLFYKGVMALAQAKGMDLILTEDTGINLYMPERIVIECREEITHLIEDITTKIGLIEGFNDEPKEPVETIQRRKLIEEETTVQPMYAPPGVEPIGPIEGTPGPQLLYAPPSVNPIGPIEATPEVQPMYAPPGIEARASIPQMIYAPPSVTTPEYEPIPNTSTTGLIEKNYVSKHPRLIGGLGAAVGLFGIPTILSDDLDEEEEKRYN